MHDLDMNIANLNDVHGKLKSFGDFIKGTDELKAERDVLLCSTSLSQDPHFLERNLTKIRLVMVCVQPTQR
jgi:hypothetical protein